VDITEEQLKSAPKIEQDSARPGLISMGRRHGQAAASLSKAAADEARRAAAKTALWMTAAMVIGAFAAALAAIEGGQLRDGRWHGVIGASNYRTQRTM
jgi:hypothetical protein